MRTRELTAALVFLVPAVTAACGWDPSRPFDREAPEVKEAIVALDAGNARGAADTLEGYLSTGACKEGSIGLPDAVRRLPNGSFDLGLALFKMGESFGARFGDEEMDAGMTDDARQKRAGQIACGLEIAQHVASDEAVPLDLRARARYLEGNLDFLSSDYEASVKAYDEALRMAPGMVDAGDPVGRDAAWNRSIALRRIDDEKDAGNDASPPDGSPGDSGRDNGDASAPDSGKPDSGSGDSGTSSPDSGSPPPSSPDGGDGQDASAPPPDEPDAAPAPPPRENQDDRVLDQLENAPTVQQEEAKKRAATHRHVRGPEDK